MPNVSMIDGHIDEPKKCGECAHYEECSPYTTPDETFPEVGGCPAFSKPTNYDRIRNKSIKEMAEFLHKIVENTESCTHCPANDFCDENVSKFGCTATMLKEWLETEVTE